MPGANDLASIGIDAESDEPMREGVLSHIAILGKLTRLDAGLLPVSRLGHVLSSAQKSVYKAWYPPTGALARLRVRGDRLPR